MSRRSISLVDPRRIIRDEWDDFFNMSPFTTTTSYPMDMYETDSDFVVEIEAPGFKEEDVEISIEDSTLTISGSISVENEKEDQNRKYHYKEISNQSFSRSVILPAKVNAEESEAEFKKGLIIVNIPKVEDQKSKKVQIKTRSN